MLLPIISLLSLLALVNGDAIHQDTRCNCVCPDPSVSQSVSNPSGSNLVGDEGDRRAIYINSTVSPDQCNCPMVVLIHLNLTDTQADSFCPRCLCKYQTRSLTVIKVVVILVVWVILLLLFYMAFLSILEPILSKKRGNVGGLRGLRSAPNIGYSEHHDATESDNEGSGTGAEATQMQTYQGTAEGVINRLGTQQSKWKLQVQEQRRNIYDRHAMLN